MRGSPWVVHISVMRFFRTSSIVLTILVTFLTNGFGWAFDAATIAHDLDHERHAIAPDAADHLAIHHESHPDDDDLDAAVHLHLHAMGHVLPCVTSSAAPVSVSTGTEVHVVFVPAFIPDATGDPLLRPPRNTLAS